MQLTAFIDDHLNEARSIFFIMRTGITDRGMSEAVRTLMHLRLKEERGAIAEPQRELATRA